MTNTNNSENEKKLRLKIDSFWYELSPVENIIYKFLLSSPFQRQELSYQTGISRTQLYQHLCVLEALNIVERFRCSNEMVGRDKVYWRVKR